MPTRPTKSIAEQLNSAQLALTNPLKDPEILKRLGNYGYNLPRIKEGQQKLAIAREAYGLHQSLTGAQHDSTASVNKTTKQAYQAYQSLAKTARAIWIKDKAMLDTLGIKGAMPKTTAGFLAASYTLFDNATANDGLLKELSNYGYTKAKLATERAKIEALDKINQIQEAAKGAAQDAAKSQQAALNDLNEWMARYIKIAKVALYDRKQLLEKMGILARSGKTKKQRAAPAKAKATRAAKKSS